MPPSISTRLFGRFELLEQIGAGGMGDVFRARDLDLHRDVAIKFVAERLASDPQRIARFAQEARTASSLNHPAILTIHEIGEADGRPFIVMELVEGQTLRQMLQRGALPPRRVLDIASQVASGLAKAHAAGIVHRDLKPENVMVTPDGFAKILDFGLAKLRPEPLASATAGDSTTRVSVETAGGAILGTAGYMAPEQAMGAAIDYRADQFALGAIIYEMATGRRAFRRESLVQTLSSVIESEPEPLSDLNPAFPEPAAWIVTRCLAKDPQDRYASTLDLAHDLRLAREHLGDSRSAGSGVSPSRRAVWLAGRRAQVPGLIVLALALLLFTAWPGRIVEWVRPSPLPPVVRLAVLLDDSQLPNADRQRLAGLLHYTTFRLADLHRFADTLTIVPATELREAHVRSPGDARRSVGATLAASVTLQRVEDDLVVSVSLDATDAVRVLRGDVQRFAAHTMSEEAIVEMIMRLLRVQLAADDRAWWMAGSSAVAEARTLFALGMSQTPYQTAETALERHDLEQSLLQAITLFNRVIELDPRYADARARLGEAYLLLYRLTGRAEHIELAQQNAEGARERDETRPAVWITLGMIHAQKREFPEAEQAFQNAILRGPRSDAAHREFGRALQRAGDHARAEVSYRKAIDLAPDAWTNHNAFGAFLQRAGRHTEAEEAFRAATARAPDNARAWSNLGALQYYLGRVDDAEQSLEHAVTLYPYGPALSNLATLRFRIRRQYEDAARLFERAAAIAPRDYRIRRNLASALYWAPGLRDRAGAPLDAASALLEEALALEPDGAEVLVALADVRAMQGRADAARALVGKAVALAPADADVASLAAGAMETIGDREEALRHVRTALVAGVPAAEFDSDPAFERLVADPRYRALAKEAGAPVNPR
jgi:tetratricopeptide (TPR) repeat protein